MCDGEIGIHFKVPVCRAKPSPCLSIVSILTSTPSRSLGLRVWSNKAFWSQRDRLPIGGVGNYHPRACSESATYQVTSFACSAPMLKVWNRSSNAGFPSR